MQLQPKTLFHGRYRLVEMKGRGAFGEVWLARDEELNNIELALKIYIAMDNGGIADFKKECINTFGLNHPNLLHAYHFDQTENRPYLVMPYCSDSSTRLIGRADETTLWHFVHDVASGLAYLHDKDIVHRDIKPDNVLRDAEGNFLITDFGISKKMHSTFRRFSTSNTDAGLLTGSLSYMAPELFTTNAEAVKATDIWALGATLYEMTVGEMPFFGQGGVMQLNGAEMPEIRANCSTLFKQIVWQCLAKNPWDRPTAAQLIATASEALGKESKRYHTPIETYPQSSYGDFHQKQCHREHYEPDFIPDTIGVDHPKRKGWIIGIASSLAVAAIVALVLLIGTKDNNTFNACTNVNDYRAYVTKFGYKGKHYAEAKHFIDNYIADSTKKAQQKAKEVVSLKENEPQMDTSNPSNTFVVIDGTDLRLRLSPSTDSETFRWKDGSNRHPKVGERFKYLGEQGDFYQIDFHGHTLWVSKSFTHLDDDSEDYFE